MRVGVVLIFIFFINGCAKSHTEGARSPPKVLRIPLYQDISGLDPKDAQNILTSNIARHIYDCLVDYDPFTLKLVPELARSYGIKDSGKTYIFKLRENVYFHDDPCFEGGKGRKLTSFDVKFSLNRTLEAYPQVAQNIIKISTPDSLTVVIELKKPRNDFLFLLAGNLGYVVPEEAIKYYKDVFRYHPVGTGPFRAVLVDPPVKIILVKNPKYWKKWNGVKLPLLDVVEFQFIITPHLEASFRRGELDICPVSLPAPPEAGSTKVYESVKLNTLGIAFNMTKENPYSKNRLLRRALFHALPNSYQDDINATAFIPPGILKLNGRLKDKTKAKELLRLAGYSQRKPPPLRIYLPAGDENTYGSILRNSFQSIGVDVEIVPVPRCDYWENVRSDIYSCFRMGWIAENLDPRSFYSAFYSLSPENLTNFHNRIYDSLFLLSHSLKDEKELRKIYEKLEELLYEEMPFIYMKHEKLRYTVQKNVENFEYSANPMNRWYLEIVNKR